MSSAHKPTPKRARASSVGARPTEHLLEAFYGLAAEERFAGLGSLRELGTLQRWANAGRMMGSAAHEMRGALTAAQMNLEYLAAEICKPEAARTGEEVSQAAQEAQQGIRRALAAVQGVVSLALGGPPAVMSLSVVDAVERAIASVAPRMRGLPAIELSCEGAALVEAEAGALHQALVSLLMNAADAVSEARPMGCVRVAVSAAPGVVRVAISDSGSTKPRDAHAAAANPWLRRDAGLGLSLSRALVHAFGGELSATEGGPNGGCEFTLSLRPASDAS
ncbi:MAG: hypothetical protein NVS4B10_24070 [Myxococcales bacterium]